MKTNVGTVDRVLGISVGLALIAASLSGYIGHWALGMDWCGAAGNLRLSLLPGLPAFGL